MSLQIGIASYFNPDLSRLRIMQLLLETGFNVISVWGADRDGMGPMPKPYKKQLLQARKYFGVTLESMHAPLLLTADLYSPDESIRTAGVERLKLAIADAVDMDIPILIVHAHRTGDRDEILPAGQRSFSELAAIVSGLPLRLAVENTPGSIALLEWILGEFPAEQVGLCYDSSHDWLRPGQRFELLSGFSDRLLTTHLSDNHGQSDDHLPPGEGCIDWQAFAAAFPWKSYKGYFMLEPLMTNSAFTDPAEFLRKSRDGAKKILDMGESTA